MESLTLNLYGIAPGDEQRYINAVSWVKSFKI